MAKSQPPADIFVQFASFAVTLASTATASQDKNTGLSVRGAIMWLIHWVDIYFSGGTVGSNEREDCGLNTRKSQPSVPVPEAKGTIAYESLQCVFVSSGASDIVLRKRTAFFPPMPLAAPNLTFYARRSGGVALTARCRLGYTTEPIDAKDYAEIAETWAFVD